MKRLTSFAFAALTAAALLGAPLAAAQPYQGGPPHGGNPWGGPARPGWHHWRAGDRFQGSRYQVNNWQSYHLPPPRPGYTWARSGGEFVMLGGNGVVGSVIVNPSYP